MRFFYVGLPVRARSELIVSVLLDDLLDELKRSHEDYQLLAVGFSLSMVNGVTDITIIVSSLNGRSSSTQNFEITNYCSS